MEAALSVHTAAVVADTTVSHTLIQIWQRQTESIVNTNILLECVCTCVRACVCVTSALRPGCSGLESSRTLTDVRPRRVHTFPMCTRASLTFVLIWRANMRLKNFLPLHVP